MWPLGSDFLPAVLAVVARSFPQGTVARPVQEIYALLGKNLRIEQERISFDVAVAAIEEAVSIRLGRSGA